MTRFLAGAEIDRPSYLDMQRYLTLSQISSALEVSKSVEQFLGGSADGVAIAWLEIRPAGDTFELWHFEVCDDGHEEFLDLYSFSPVHGDWPDEAASSHATPDQALNEASRKFGADPARWVNQFLIQEEYRNYRRARPPVA